MSQTFTSAATSINSHKAPAIYGKIDLTGETVLDYGCGKYPDVCRAAAMAAGAADWTGFDPYNLPSEDNMRAWEHRYSVAVMSNVINVIDNDDAVLEALFYAAYLTYRRVVYVTVYAGDRSGIGRQTGRDSYQRNMTPAAWVEWINSKDCRMHANLLPHNVIRVRVDVSNG